MPADTRPTLAPTQAPPAAESEPDGLPVPRRYWAMLAIALALTLAVLDSAIANVALPTIARDLHANPAESIWIVNAYQLATVVSLLPLASLGDIIGYRRVYQAGLILFTLASLACALTRSIDALALARIVQGFGAAGHHERQRRARAPHLSVRPLGRAIGINAMVVSVAAAIGPTVASAILRCRQWPWLFGVNVPIGIAAIVVASFALPRTPTSERRFDWPSALLNAAAFGLLVVRRGDLGPRRGRRSARPEVVAGTVAAALLVAASGAGPRRSSPSICCAFRSSACRSRPRSARSPPRCWPSSPCRSSSRRCSDARRSRPGF